MDTLVKSGTPLHYQISLLLREAIQSGRFMHEKFPTEQELGQQYGVCRFTVRRALHDLEAAGLIERRQGVGTFVRKPSAEAPLHVPISSLLTHLDAFDAGSTVQVLSSAMTRPTLQARGMLGLNDDEDVLQLVRMRSRDGRPVLQATHSIPRAVGRKVRQRDLQMPIYRMLDRAVGVDRVEQVVSAVLASPIVARRLQVSVGSALLHVERTFHLGDEVVGCSELLASPVACQVRMVLDEPSTARD